MPDLVAELLERGRGLGSDRRNTNYTGGNTSDECEAHSRARRPGNRSRPTRRR